jgi:hypothetical protein
VQPKWLRSILQTPLISVGCLLISAAIGGVRRTIKELKGTELLNLRMFKGL